MLYIPKSQLFNNSNKKNSGIPFKTFFFIFFLNERIPYERQKYDLGLKDYLFLFNTHHNVPFHHHYFHNDIF